MKLLYVSLLVFQLYTNRDLTACQHYIRGDSHTESRFIISIILYTRDLPTSRDLFADDKSAKFDFLFFNRHSPQTNTMNGFAIFGLKNSNGSMSLRCFCYYYYNKYIHCNRSFRPRSRQVHILHTAHIDKL